MSSAGKSFSESKNGVDADSGTALKRNSTIYSKPVWPTQQVNSDNPKDHKYAQPVTSSADKKLQDPGVYSYAYQHQFHPTQQPPEEMDKKSKGYQQLGMVDYMHMYSKPSPLLGNLSRPNNPSANAKAEKQ